MSDGDEMNQANPPLPILPPREADSHKGDYGRGLLIGGSQGMAGAVALAGVAALRSGAGLVTIATAECCLSTVAAFEPSYMTRPLPSDDQGRIDAAARDDLLPLAKRMTAVGIGPGLGQSPGLVELVTAAYRDLDQPMVVDADALNNLATEPNALAHHQGPRILTPHAGELARLLKKDHIEAELRTELAQETARQWNVVLVLKGHHTLVTDGQQVYCNTTGNPGMATGGCGDVLTGIITGLLCQGLDPFAAAQLGVYLHGLAGDYATDDVGEVSLIASDLLDTLPAAILSLNNESGRISF